MSTSGRGLYGQISRELDISAGNWTSQRTFGQFSGEMVFSVVSGKLDIQSKIGTRITNSCYDDLIYMQACRYSWSELTISFKKTNAVTCICVDKPYRLTLCSKLNLATVVDRGVDSSRGRGEIF